MPNSDGTGDVQIPGSFELFYRQEYSSVVALVYGLTGNGWVAEDLAQDAFLRAHKDWQRVRRMDSSGGWVRRVAVNLAMSRFRRLRAETSAKLRLDRTTRTAIPDADPESQEFWDVVRRLPVRQAQVLAFRYIEELSVAEIGQMLGVADGTVKALLHQGRERARRQLLAKGVIEG